MNKVSHYIKKANNGVDFVLGGFLNISQVLRMSPSPYYDGVIENEAAWLLASSLPEYVFGIWMAIKECNILNIFHPPFLVWIIQDYKELNYMLIACILIYLWTLSYVFRRVIKWRKKRIYRMFRNGGRNMRIRSLITAVVMLCLGCWKILIFFIACFFS